MNKNNMVIAPESEATNNSETTDGKRKGKFSRRLKPIINLGLALTLTIGPTACNNGSNKKTFTIEKGQTLGSLTRDSLLSTNGTLSEEVINDWTLCKKIVEEICEENNIKEEDKQKIPIGTEITVDLNKVNKIIDAYAKDFSDQGEGFKITGAKENEKNGGYHILKTLQDFKECNDPYVKLLYRDSAYSKPITDTIKGGNSIRIPMYMESKESKRYTIDEITKPDEIIDNILAGKKFVLDPGHGFNDPGTIGIAQFGEEKDKVLVFEAPVTMDIAYRLAKELRSHGAEVTLTHYIPTRPISDAIDLPPARCISNKYQDLRNDGSGNTMGEGVKQKESLNTRAKLANKESPTCLISIHIDKEKNPNAQIMSIKYDDRQNLSKESQALANGIINNGGAIYVNGKGEPLKSINYSVDAQHLGVLKGCKSPAVLIECGNIQNTSQAYYFRTGDRRQLAAERLARGIINYYKNK